MVIHRLNGTFRNEFGEDPTRERPAGASDILSSDGKVCGCYTMDGHRGADGNFYGAIHVYTHTGWFDKDTPVNGHPERFLPSGKITCNANGVTLEASTIGDRPAMATGFPARVEFDAIGREGSEPHNMIRMLAENAPVSSERDMLERMGGWTRPGFTVQLHETGAVNGLRSAPSLNGKS